MKRKAKVSSPPVAGEGDDPRFVKVMDAFAKDPKLAPIIDAYAASKMTERGYKFGSNGLKVDGKLFAMVVRGNLVVKLPKDRVDAIVAAGRGQNFDPGHGRKMKEWLTVTSPRLSWVDLAREAHDFVSRAKGSRPS